MPLTDVLPQLVDRVSPGLAGTTGGRYLGYVTGGLLPAGAIAQAWAVGVDQNTGLWAVGPAATELEQTTLGWIADLLELPHRGSTFTSGAAGANLVCLAVARHWVGKELGVDVNLAGVGPLGPIRVYGSSELHFTNVKALRTLGLGADCVRHVAVDDEFRLSVPDLVAAIEQDRAAGVRPAIVVAHAAAANTGACDPLREIADVCRRYGLWLHVDGAFGAFLRLSAPYAHLVDGLDLADSVTVDGHKWLNLPNGIAFAFLRDAELHHETFAGTAAYLTRTEGAGLDLHELGVEASRPWRGAATWAVVKHLGREGIAQLVTRCCLLAAELGRLVEASPRLELTAPVASCVTCFRYRPAESSDGTRARRAQPPNPGAPRAGRSRVRDGRHAAERVLAPTRDRQLAHLVRGRRPSGRGGRPAGRRALGLTDDSSPRPCVILCRARAVSSAGRAPALHAGGRRFESCTAHAFPQIGNLRMQIPDREDP